MSEETFWVVQRRATRRYKWITLPWTLSKKCLDPVLLHLWEEEARLRETRPERPLVRCVKVRVVPVELESQ